MAKRLTKVPGGAVREPKVPKCPLHSSKMVYAPASMRWECQVRDCKQIVFQEEDVANGKPVLGRGVIEVVLVEDTEGDKRGRVLLRAVDNNVILDITDYVENRDSDRHLAPDNGLIHAYFVNVLDNRKKD